MLIFYFILTQMSDVKLRREKKKLVGEVWNINSALRPKTKTTNNNINVEKFNCTIRWFNSQNSRTFILVPIRTKYYQSAIFVSILQFSIQITINNQFNN